MSISDDTREIAEAIDRLASAIRHLAAVTAAGIPTPEATGIPPFVTGNLTYELGGNNQEAASAEKPTPSGRSPVADRRHKAPR